MYVMVKGEQLRKIAASVQILQDYGIQTRDLHCLVEPAKCTVFVVLVVSYSLNVSAVCTWYRSTNIPVERYPLAFPLRKYSLTYCLNNIAKSFDVLTQNLTKNSNIS